MQRYAAEQGVEFACPALPPLAHEAMREIEKLPMKDVCLVGSSLGGFYATYLAEKHRLKAALLNPAIDPHVGLRAYLGPQKNLQTDEPYELTEVHLKEWAKLYVPKIVARRYLLIVETGDEVLDYRNAVERYRGCRQIVIDGSDHGLGDFGEYLETVLEFCGVSEPEKY